MTISFIDLEKNIIDLERNLSIAATIPILGQLAGAIKVILGIIQTIGGLLALLVSTPFLCTKKGKAIFCRSGSHFVNGLANIGAGILEATPVVGNLIGLHRWYFGFSRNPWIAGQERKVAIFGYKVLDQLSDPDEKARYSNLAYLPL